MAGYVLWLTAALQLLALAQGAFLKDQHQSDEGLEKSRLAAALAMSAIWPQHMYEDAREVRRRRETEIDETETGPAKPVQASEGGEDGEDPPSVGLRRWVIRIRNFMFGRRDLEGDGSNGEEEGDPPAGQSWMETLANWFAHGIRRVLVRISGGNPDDDNPDVEGGVVTGGTTAESDVQTTTLAWTALPPVSDPTTTESSTPPSAPRSTQYPSTRGPPRSIAVSDEETARKHAPKDVSPLPEETNEIS